MAFRRPLSLLLSKQAKKKVDIYDVTLRDGMQGLGMSLSLPDKVRIAELLDDMGFTYIEGGYPLSNPKDQEFFKEASKRKFKSAQVCAFGMTHRKGIRPENDEGMKCLLDSKAPVVTIVGKTWDLHVQHVLNCELEENCEMIRDSLAFFKGKVDKIFYDAEHYFDGYKADPEYAFKTVMAAVEGGAECIILCDTNGGSLPHEVFAAVKTLRSKLPAHVGIGIHVHDDGGLATANSLAAVDAGAVQIQGTINGIGERCGNVDLTSVIPNLRLKMGYDCINEDALGDLTFLSRTVSELTNTASLINQPWVGQAAFAHKGGMHVHAVAKIPHSYEHINPKLVGNERRVVVSELAGHSNVTALLGKRFGDLDKGMKHKVVKKVAELENEGYQFEAAIASFELLVQGLMNRNLQYWDLNSYRCVVYRTSSNSPVACDAIVKATIAGKKEYIIGEGGGPVHALDAAMRQALMPHYPSLKKLQLVDYRVRVVNPNMSTGAKVRVLGDFNIETPTGTKAITTIGVHDNIINASLQVIEEAFIWHLIEEGVVPVEKAKAAPGFAQVGLD